MAITSDKLVNRTFSGAPNGKPDDGEVVRVLRSWPGGPPRGTVISGMPAGRRKQLLAARFVELVENAPQAPKPEHRRRKA